jgi:hypothetical protein
VNPLEKVPGFNQKQPVDYRVTMTEKTSSLGFLAASTGFKHFQLAAS